MEDKYPDTIRNVDIDSICTDSKFGELNFQPSVLILKQMAYEIVELEDLDFRSYLTGAEIVQIDGVRNTVKNYINQIESFTITQPNASEARDVIIQSIQQYYDNSFASQIRQSLLYLRDKVRLNTKSSETEYRKLATELQRLVEEVKVENEKLKLDQDSIKQQRGIVSSQYLSQFFEKESVDYKNDSLKLKYKFNWLTLLLASLVVVIFLVYFFFIRELDGSSLKIEFGILATTFIAVIFFYVRVTLREYNITKHIQISNKHRSNVASTLEVFLAQATQDADLKIHLVKEASTAIFQSESTGYLTKDQIEINTPIKEVVNTVMNHK